MYPRDMVCFRHKTKTPRVKATNSNNNNNNNNNTVKVGMKELKQKATLSTAHISWENTNVSEQNVQNWK